MDIILAEIIKETYLNLIQEDSHKYKHLEEEDFDEIAENIIEKDEFWDTIDSFILDELIKKSE